jgi:hypothetical protein
MPWTTALPILIWFLIFLPVSAFLWLYIPKHKFTAIVILLIYLGAHLILYWTFNWSLVSYYLRYIPLIYWIILAARYYLALLNYPFFPKKGTAWILPGVLFAILAITVYFDYRIALSFTHPGEHVLLMFPLRKGIYSISNGGNSEDGIGMNNYVNPWFTQEAPPDPDKAYAADIMRINTSGRVSITRSILPESVHEYEGYRDQIYGPCVGKVVYTEDDHPDVMVGEQGTELGNYIVLQCSDYFVTLANLKSGSIIVDPGEQINTRLMLAQVGNSGTPSVPHLLIYAKMGGWKDGEGTPIPMLFDGVFSVNNFLFRNKIVIR